MSEMAPTVPGKIRPGLRISIVIPSTPSDIRRTMMFGSMSVSRIRFQSDISTRSTLRAGGVQDEVLRLRLHAVDLVEQGGEVGRDDVDDVLFQRFLGAEVGGLAHRVLGPVAVAPWVSASSRA